MRHALFNNYPCGFELRDLVGVVGEQTDTLLADKHEHPRGDAEITRLNRKTKAEVSINGIKPLILKFISAEFVDQANPAPFLPQVEQDAPASLSQERKCGLKL